MSGTIYFRLAVSFLALAALAACAPASRLTQPEATGTRSGATASAPEGLRVTAVEVIAGGGPGSWVKDAPWDEVVVRFANPGSEPVTVTSLGIASGFAEPAMHSTSRTGLEEKSRGNTKAWQEASAGFGIVAASVSGAELVLAGAYAAGTPALAVGAIIAAPVLLIGAPVYLIRKSMREDEDRKLIDAELMRRAMPLPITLIPGGRIEGSAFFPFTYGERRLVVRYGEPERSLELLLPPHGLRE